MNRNPRPGAAAQAAPPDLGWQEHAACRGADPDLFFAREPEPDADIRAFVAAENDRTDTAKAICRSCPVRLACLDYRLSAEHQIDGGVWGGLGETERWLLRKRRVRAAAAAKRRAA